MRFLDSNVPIYTVDSAEPAKQAVARAIVASNAMVSNIVISTQVLQEFYWTASRKFANRTEPHVVVQALRDFTRFRVVQVDIQMILAGVNRVRTASISFWDALIVEAALSAGATRLVTEDLQDGHVFDGVLRVENPFRVQVGRDSQL